MASKIFDYFIFLGDSEIIPIYTKSNAIHSASNLISHLWSAIYLRNNVI